MFFFMFVLFNALQTPSPLIKWLSNPLVKIYLRRRHAQTVKNGASSHKTTCIDIFSKILNLEGHLNSCIGSKVTAILLNGWILPNGRFALGRACASCLRSRLLFLSVPPFYLLLIYYVWLKSTYRKSFNNHYVLCNAFFLSSLKSYIPLTKKSKSINRHAHSTVLNIV